ncbi:MAG: hypothetical protein KF826_10060 [Xanthobacteraceae bacterium]|nr:hypothetical protein [Xanthobacteraceae bacterium]MBX3522268.1 hypothetical protein [Xanthobacteraceae bacterium]MBX3534685.1 hypothetical protein [Xanthobacteraceae bacterium]MBX3549715.1 hypothetical protein [Xanthobacteraceae bacterium]MCW5675160.1 hypothetical protein [Xanthobacteraceae bacterium]
MKVVQELVNYFDRRGELSPKQLRALLDQGFLAAEAPANMIELGQDVGANYYFRVKGETEGQVWGTDIYTGDSMLSVAVVHAGIVKPGDTAVVKVTVVEPLQQYEGSLRNNIKSHDFGRYGTAYKLSAI